MNETGINIFTDGGARGNPGPAACAFVVFDGGKEVAKGSKYLGATTNNVAEYQGVILSTKWLRENINTTKNRTVTFLLDSELVVRQLIGVYKVKDNKLQELFAEALNEIKDLNLKPLFKHVPRSQNKIADQMVNIELDKNILK